MKIVVSPAKTLELKRTLPTDKNSKPQFLKEAIEINHVMAKKNKSELAALLHVSQKLTNLNYERIHQFSSKNTSGNARPAVFTFNGDVYEGLEAYTFKHQSLGQLQKHLRILSGMYGLLKPLDLIQPYRLDMGIKLSIGDCKNLYEFWQQKITKSLNDEMKPGELLINLASTEYFKAIDKKTLKAKIVSPIFKDFINGNLKVISFYAKKARGMMTRYIIDNKVTTAEGILSFDKGRYRFSEKYTVHDHKPVFVR